MLAPWLVLFAWAPHEQAADAPHDVKHVADVSVDVVEDSGLLDESGAPKEPFEIDILELEAPRLL